MESAARQIFRRNCWSKASRIIEKDRYPEASSRLAKQSSPCKRSPPHTHTVSPHPSDPHLLAELLYTAPSLDEVLKKLVLTLQVPGGEQSQVHHQVIRGALVVEGGQQLWDCGLLLHLFYQVHELQGKGRGLRPSKGASLATGVALGGVLWGRGRRTTDATAFLKHFQGQGSPAFLGLQAPLEF